MQEVLAAVRPVVVKVVESSNGVSLESIFVFIGGVLAAIAAVAAAIITTRGASSRLEQQLNEEKERFDKQLAAEEKRYGQQFDHERYLARRAEASQTVEQIVRMLAQSQAQVGSIVSRLKRGQKPSSDDWQGLSKQLDLIREEVNVLAIRFGSKSPIVLKTLDLLNALRAAIPDENIPMTKEQEEEASEGMKRLHRANADFLIAGKAALETY